MRRLVFGCGYLGERVARRWLEAGDRVAVVTRNATRAEDFCSSGFDPIVADVCVPESLAQLPAADTVLFAVGYDRARDRSIEEVYASGVANVLSALREPKGQLIYISSTGVYGDAEGGWVDELTPCNPQRAGGRASLEAERAVRAAGDLFANGSTVLRLAGIYGPNRVPFLDKLRAGDPIPAPANGHLNLIHVDDAAEIVIAVADYPGPCEPVMCVSDGAPPVRGDYYREAARLIGAPEPTFTAPPPDSPRAARAGADKQVRCDLMKKTLGVKLRYPDYRAGLAAILAR